MSISLNIEASSINISRLFQISFASFASNSIKISVNYNIKINSIEFFCSFCVSDSSFDDSANLFYNVNNDVIFNNKILL